MRICSFLPSATEIVYGLGLEESLHGVTYECDHPAPARSKPVVVHSIFENASFTSSEVDRIISERMAEGKGIYDIDQEVLGAAEPDLLLTQELCEE